MSEVRNCFEVLEQEWLRRIELVKQGITPEKRNQRNLFYDIRFLAKRAGVKMVDYATFKYNHIYRLESKYKPMKEDLNIRSEPDAMLYKRFGKELIEYKGTIYECIAIIATEKNGIAEMLQEFLPKYGIFVVSTKGIQGRYAMQMMKAYNVPKYCIDDYDTSGCFMMKRFEKIGVPRITLFDIMKETDLKWEDVSEVDDSIKNNHWNSIDEEDKRILRRNGITYRIEIDTVMGMIKVEQFVDIVLKILDRKIKIKDMSKMMILDLPTQEQEKLRKRKLKLIEKYADIRKRILSQYSNLQKPFKEINLVKLEEEAQIKFDKAYERMKKKNNLNYVTK